MNTPPPLGTGSPSATTRGLKPRDSSRSWEEPPGVMESEQPASETASPAPARALKSHGNRESMKDK